MKKLIISCCFIFIALLPGYAQLLDGDIGPNFIETDINGNEHNLYELLEQGKSVIMDFSATWCNPCWVHHQTHILNDAWLAYGPDGTNEMYIFMIEGDPNTTLDQLMGIGFSTTGDWTEGTDYPIINQEIASPNPNRVPIMYDYNVNLYPTYIHVCPDYTITRLYASDLQTLDDFVAYNNTCESLNAGTDASLVSIDNNWGDGGCEEVSFVPTIKVQNYGTEEITAMEIELIDNGTTVQTLNWTGNLQSYNATDISFDEINVAQSNIEISINTVNGLSDDNSSDNSVEEYVIGLIEAETNVTLELTIEDDSSVYEIAADNYWAVLNENDEIVAEGGNILVGLTNFEQAEHAPDHPTALTGDSLYTVEIALQENQCYRFVITDHYGNGIIGLNDRGYYKMFDGAGNLMFEGAKFEFIETRDFSFTGEVSPTDELSINASNTMDLYPNPTLDVLTISYNLENTSSLDGTFQILDSRGALLDSQSEHLTNGNNITTLDLSQLSSGLYFIKLDTRNGSIMERVVKH